MRLGLILVGISWLAVRSSSFSPQGRLIETFRPVWSASLASMFVGRIPDEPWSHTYVEGTTFDDRAAEVEAMGGGK